MLKGAKHGAYTSLCAHTRAPLERKIRLEEPFCVAKISFLLEELRK